MSRRTAPSLQLWPSRHRASRWSRPQEQDDFIWNTDIISFLVLRLRLRAETLKGTEMIHQIGLLFLISMSYVFDFVHSPVKIFFAVEVVKDSTREMSWWRGAAALQGHGSKGD